MLPHVFQAPQIRQPFDGSPRDEQFTSRSDIPRTTKLQLLPYRISQNQLKSTALAPPQRAFPIHQSQGSYTSDVPNYGGQHYDTSEHMLRRKTPNGTLAAGYDGTPVQWATKPPPSKHIVLPSSEATSMMVTVPNSEFRGVPQSAQRNHNIGHFNHPASQGMPNTHNGAFGDHTRLPSLFNGSNTIFDRIPMHQAPTYFLYDGNGMQVPTVLQPLYQPCLGPTASNDGGLYGPYWPDVSARKLLMRASRQ